MRSDHTRKSHHSSSPDVLGAYVAEINRCADAVYPDANAYMALHTAMFGLTNRRAKAYMDMFSAFACCESSEEFVQEQSRFYQGAIDDYADCSRRVMAAWSEAVNFEPLYGGEKIVNGHDNVVVGPELKVVSTLTTDVPAEGESDGQRDRSAKVGERRVAGVREAKARNAREGRRRAD